MKEFLKDDKILIDMLRILSRVAEKEEFGYEIASIENIENILSEIFNNY